MRLVLAAVGLAVTAALYLAVQPGPAAIGETPTPTPTPFRGAPANFEGFACIDADCIGAIGNPVVAKIGDVECGQATTAMPYSDGQPVSRYRIEVAADEEVPGCGTVGVTIDFYIDGRKAKQTGTWANGGVVALDIWVGEDFASFSGYSTCNGKPCYLCFDPCATATFEAYVGDVHCGSLIPSGWLIINHYGPLTVMSAAQKPGCGTQGAKVTFKIDDLIVYESATWSPGFYDLSLTAGHVIWGDNDCSRTLDATDVLRILRYLMNDPPDPPTCFALSRLLAIQGSNKQVRWANIDCTYDFTILDAIKTLQAASGLEIDQEEGCPLPGDSIGAYPVPDK